MCGEESPGTGAHQHGTTHVSFLLVPRVDIGQWRPNPSGEATRQVTRATLRIETAVMDWKPMRGTREPIATDF